MLDHTLSPVGGKHSAPVRSPRGERRGRPRHEIRGEVDRLQTLFLSFLADQEGGTVVASQRELAGMFDARLSDLRRALANVCVSDWWLADRAAASDDCCGVERYPVLEGRSSAAPFAPYRYTLRGER